MNRYFFFILIFFLFSCKTGPSLFNSATAHERYSKQLISAGLEHTALGEKWFAAANDALNAPQPVTLPYAESGYFPADEPRATGLSFAVKRGQVLNIGVNKNPASGNWLFLELWKKRNGRTDVEQSSDSSLSIRYEVKQDDSLVLRLQPELLQSGNYSLSISIGPSLQFPVSGKGRKIGSFWGDPRDEGGRRHEGVDIFAARGTPVVAGADGIIGSVTENNLGGKVIFLRVSGKDYSLYYAHLDSQWVQPGLRVRKGDSLGAVGNTGNARTTAPHLHFGIYTTGGAINPLNFIDPVEKTATVPPSLKPDKLLARFSVSVTSPGAVAYSANSMAKVMALSSSGYRLILPNGNKIMVASRQVELDLSPLKTMRTKQPGPLLEKPDVAAAKMQSVAALEPVSVMGYYKNFAWVRLKNGVEGWFKQIPETSDPCTPLGSGRHWG
jgi:murein DD-endopeptidase MepM/ murein hydrolase activator NlpD